MDSGYRRFHKAHAEAKAEGGFLPRRKADGKPKYFPRRKSRQGRKADGFTIPDKVRMDGNRLRIPRMGWGPAGAGTPWSVPGLRRQDRADAE